MQKANQAIEPAQVRTMAQRVEDRMLIIIASREGAPEMRAAYAEQLEQMRRQLGAGAHADPLEALLIERIILTWIRVQWCEEQLAYTMMRNSTDEEREHWDRRLDHAHGRFLQACTALARVRKLQRRPDKFGGEQIGVDKRDFLARGGRVS